MSLPTTKELVVIAYPNQWHWVLSLEYINRRINQGAEIEVLDLSWCGEYGLRSAIRRQLKFRHFEDACVKWLASKSVVCRRKSTIIKNAYRHQVEKEDKITKEDCGPAFNSIVERTGELNVNYSSNKRVIIQEFNAMASVNAALSEVDANQYDHVTTVNGRFTKNATVATWSKSNSKDTSLLEFGSSLQRFEVFSNSPHSMNEVEEKIEKLWDQFDPSERASLASRFLTKFVEASTLAENVWRSKMLLGNAPAQTEKKRCVFFSSTEAEYAGVGDSIAEGNFKNQVDAFRGLLNVIDFNTWEVYLRRHPKHPNTSHGDPEQHLWQEFELHESVIVLPPDSAIDSIELAKSADLNVNYCSTIAVELIASGVNNVLTLGPAPWNRLVPSRFCPSESSIKQILDNELDEINSAQLLPWFLYTNLFGEGFKLFDYCSANSTWRLK